MKRTLTVKRVYIETTIPSYLASQPSRDLLQAARQQITHTWWNDVRQNYDLCISEIVLDEVASGDTDAAQRRLSFLNDLPLLDLTNAVNDIAKAIMNSGLLPQGAARDAIHIAVSSVHGIDILVDLELPTHCQCGNYEGTPRNRVRLWL